MELFFLALGGGSVTLAFGWLLGRWMLVADARAEDARLQVTGPDYIPDYISSAADQRHF